jgi:hypothetical protein
MSNMNNPENVSQQYAGDENLSARIKLHTKHSTNKQGATSRNRLLAKKSAA